MFTYVVYCFQIFFIVLEIIVLLYMIQSVLYMGGFLKTLLLTLAYPMIYPMQKLIRRSVLGTFSVDLSPYVLLVILNYLENVCDYLMAK